ncbi:MAG: VWA domain-containing protein, partial [Gammaproteobacteria bacterium]|nr:VWA domain-containing protein [Gammaproteobacteria bacterium]
MRSVARLLTHYLLPVLLLGLFAPTAGAQSSSSSYQPCNGQDAVDIVVLMDQSASLSGGEHPTDPDEKRADGLTSIGEALAGREGIRLGIIGFSRGTETIRNLSVLDSNNPLTAGDIDKATKATGGDTDYLAGVNAALAMFGPADNGNCRVLLFFTDGVFDPGGANWVEKRATAEDLLLPAVCGSGDQTNPLAHQLRENNVQTFAVILTTGINDLSGDKLAVRNLSFQSFLAITGDNDSPLLVGVPAAPGCANWSDEASDQAGKIITVEAVGDLANSLLRLVNQSTKTVFGCPSSTLINEGSTQTEAYKSLPAGAFIASIDLYVEGGVITEIRGNGAVLPFNSANRSSQTLRQQDLAHLATGWELAVDILPTSNTKNATLTCDSEPAALPTFSAEILGSVNGEILDSVDSDLQVTVLSPSSEPYSCEDIDSLTLDSLERPQRDFNNQRCESGDLLFAWEAITGESADNTLSSLSGSIEIDHSNNLNWNPLSFVATFEPAVTITSSSGLPSFTCQNADDL